MVVVLTGAVVMVLWRPSGATGGSGINFVGAIARSEIPSATVEMADKGRTVVRITERDIVDISAAALEARGADVPKDVREAIFENVPEWLETVSGCEIDDGLVTLYVKVRKKVSLYVTITGKLETDGDGSLYFRLRQAAVGAVPLPVETARSEWGIEDVKIVDPEDADIVVREARADDGIITLSIEEYEDWR